VAFRIILLVKFLLIVQYTSKIPTSKNQRQQSPVR